MAQASHFKFAESVKSLRAEPQAAAVAKGEEPDSDDRIRLLGVRTFCDLVYARRMGVESDAAAVRKLIDTQLKFHASSSDSETVENVRFCD